jgi:5'-3' exonuclease
MKQSYIEILKNLKEDSTLNQSPNDRILVIDGLNTFIRAFAVNPSMNEDGIHIGGMTGFLQSIGYAIKNTKPTRVIICFDGKGGSSKRRKLFPEYKANRKVRKRLTRLDSFNNQEDESVSMKNQIRRLTQYLDALPITVIAPENIEADDAMAYLSQQVYPESQFYIMSTDKDFLQLVDDRVQVWSPTKKKYYFNETVLEDFEIPAYNFLLYRIMKGDLSDNIPGIRGVGVKALQKRLPILFGDRKITLEELIDYIKQSDDPSKVIADIKNSESVMRLNYDLMQLNEVDIPGNTKSHIIDAVKKPINRLVKYKFQKLMLEDKTNSAIKNPDFWLKTCFSYLEAMASKSYER